MMILWAVLCYYSLFTSGEDGVIYMKSLNIAGFTLAGLLLSIQQAFAGTAGAVVPEIDGAGAIIAIGLVAGLVALVREKFFRK